MKLNELTPKEMFTTEIVDPDFRVLNRASGSIKILTSTPQSLTEQYNLTPPSVELRALSRLIINPAIVQIMLEPNVSAVLPSDSSASKWTLRVITNRSESDTKAYLKKHGETIRKLSEKNDILSTLYVDVENGLAFTFNKDMARQLVLCAMMLRTELFNIGLYPPEFEMVGRRCPSCSHVFAVHDVKFNDRFNCPNCGRPLLEHYNGVVTSAGRD